MLEINEDFMLLDEVETESPLSPELETAIAEWSQQLALADSLLHDELAVAELQPLFS